MLIKKITVGIATLLVLTSCAVSPEDQQRRVDMEADIDEIMSYELDETEFGKPKRCLSEHEFRSHRALGDRHMLFEGRKDKMWVNVLRGRCPNLDDDSMLIVKPAMGGRFCDMDRFEVLDRFAGSTGMTCVLGEFKPVAVAKAQVDEIEKRLEMR
jgi:hypothetical protein